MHNGPEDRNRKQVTGVWPITRTMTSTRHDRQCWTKRELTLVDIKRNEKVRYSFHFLY